LLNYRVADVLMAATALQFLGKTIRYMHIDLFFFQHPPHLPRTFFSRQVMGGMSLTNAFTFCMAPVRTDDRLSFSMLSKFAEAWANGKPAALNVRYYFSSAFNL
jgi:hypothetical protein